MRNNPVSARGPLARTFPQSAAQPNAPETRMAILLSHGINETINGTFGQHFALTKQGIFGIVIFEPHFWP
jgi:hypothetical protein